MPGRLLVLALALATASTLRAAPPTAADRAALIGQPTELVVAPAKVDLSGPRDVRQLVVTGKYADGTVRDLTRAADVSADQADVLSIGEGLFVRGAKNGTATLTVTAGGKTVKVPVTVADLDAARPVSFRHDVIAAFNVGGCNAGACHGTPSGKNGFKLSLRGFDPPADYLQLTRDQFGRRTDKHNPDAALILLKALGRVAARGRHAVRRVELPGRSHRRVARRGASSDDPSNLPAVKSLRRLPRSARAARPGEVAAARRDGDVRRRHRPRRDPAHRLQQPATRRSPTWTPNGLVEFKRPGEVAVLVPLPRSSWSRSG